jgi:hypothetical protein
LPGRRAYNRLVVSDHWDTRSIPIEEQPAFTADQGDADPRPRLPDPLPVRLVAVEHVHMTAPRDAEEKLDAFYVGLLGFDRYCGPEAGQGELVFRAENFLLRFRLLDPPIVHDTLRPQGIEVLDLLELEKRFIEAELEYTRERGITPGRETLLLLDPGGNWVEIGEIRLVQ